MRYFQLRFMIVNQKWYDEGSLTGARVSSVFCRTSRAGLRLRASNSSTTQMLRCDVCTGNYRPFLLNPFFTVA
jgi:hypothetical protein